MLAERAIEIGVETLGKPGKTSPLDSFREMLIRWDLDTTDDLITQRQFEMEQRMKAVVDEARRQGYSL